MWRSFCALALTACVGCASGPLLENPLLLRNAPPTAHGNPIYLPQGPAAYAAVFEKAEDIVADYFDVAYSNRYAGEIRSAPRIAPGIEQPWRAGSPDVYQRMLAFTQTIRYRAVVSITTAPQDGFFVDVKVFKEMEDLPAPTRYTAGEASYRLESTLQRYGEIVQPDAYGGDWYPVGRDTALEQLILDRLAKMDACECAKK